MHRRPDLSLLGHGSADDGVAAPDKSADSGSGSVIALTGRAPRATGKATVADSGTAGRAALDAVRKTLLQGTAPRLPDDLACDRELADVLGQLEGTYTSLLAVTNGELDARVSLRGAMAGAIKSLQANLRHLTWQTQQIAAGDFSQRVDFMGDFSTAFNTMVESLAKSRAELQRLNALLQAQADTDALTGTFNRYYFCAAAPAEMELCRCQGKPISLMMLDIDNFKTINDRFGHQAGDQTLVRIADGVRATVRETDWLVRWGGEEFLVFAPETGLASAMVLAERIRQAVAGLCPGDDRSCTVSIGVAERADGESADSLVRRVDQAMYAAKAAGRNRVQSATR